MFDKSDLMSVDLSAIAKQQYSYSTNVALVLPSNDHLWGWKVMVDGAIKTTGIDLNLAAKNLPKPHSIPVSVGMHMYDWRFVSFESIIGKVIPILLIGSDLVMEIAKVANAIENFKRVISFSQEYLRQLIGSTFISTECLVCISKKTSAELEQLTIDSLIDTKRFDFMNQAINDVKASYGNVFDAAKQKVFISVYTGENKGTVGYGAASQGTFSVLPPHSNSFIYGLFDKASQDLCDAVATMLHEFLHTLGLKHTIDVDPYNPQARNSIMQNGKPPTAVLLPFEIDLIRRNYVFIR